MTWAGRPIAGVARSRGAVCLALSILGAVPFRAGAARGSDPELRVSAVKQEGKTWTVELRKALRIAGITFVPKRLWSGPSFKMPLSGSGTKRYADVRILKESLFQAIRDSLVEGKPKEPARLGYAIKPVFEIFSTERFRPSSLGGVHRVGTVEAVFNAELRVVVGVMRSGEHHWVSYPSLREKGKTSRQFTILEAGLKRRFEKAVLEAFHAAAKP